jgi:serine/threonine protein phosphatase PrpC
MLALEVAILTECGGRSHNEDACGHWHSDTRLCCVVADGAGGHGGGDLASRLAVERMLREFAVQPSADGPQLNRLVRRINGALIDAREPGTASADMHATVVCLVVDYVAHAAHWAHAGDSRMYRFRGQRLVGHTQDHSLVQALVDAGLLAAQQVRGHPHRSELRSALGTADDEIEISDSGAPQDVQPGDAFLLCTDGVWEFVDDATIEMLLAAAATPDAWLQGVEAAVREAARERPGHDNFSAIAVWARALPPPPEAH